MRCRPGRGWLLFALLWVSLTAAPVSAEEFIISNLSLTRVETQYWMEADIEYRFSDRAIEALVNTGADLKLYSVNNITSGTDSQGEVTVRLEKGGRLVNGQGADTDIVIASAKAYINGCNKLLEPTVRAHPQGGDV